MTTSDFRSSEELHDQRIVEALLAESGMDHPADTGELEPALMRVRNIAHGRQPTPRGEFAALLARLDAGPTTALGSGTVASLEDRRRKRHTGLVIAATALSLTVGAGAAAAAVNPDFRDTVQDTVTTLLNTLTSAPNVRPPGAPKPVDPPAPVVPVPGQPILPGPGIPDGAPATSPALSDPQRDETVPGPQTNPGFHGSPATEHPTAPAIPRPAVPAHPQEPAAASGASSQPGPIPARPAAPVTANHK